MTGLLKSAALAFVFGFVTACAYAGDSIYWSDGDSGRINGAPFRLANVDAPETGGVGGRGGAKCEKERILGYEAKEYIVGFTRGKALEITRQYGEDRYGRIVIDLSADGEDVGQAGIAAGHLKPWPHVNGKAQTRKPDWCKTPS